MTSALSNVGTLATALACGAVETQEILDRNGMADLARWKQSCKDVGLQADHPLLAPFCPTMVRLSEQCVEMQAVISASKEQEFALTLRALNTFYVRRFGCRTTDAQRITVTIQAAPWRP
jgi:hypothetical protein